MNGQLFCYLFLFTWNEFKLFERLSMFGGTLLVAAVRYFFFSFTICFYDIFCTICFFLLWNIPTNPTVDCVTAARHSRGQQTPGVFLTGDRIHIQMWPPCQCHAAWCVRCGRSKVTLMKLTRRSHLYMYTVPGKKTPGVCRPLHDCTPDAVNSTVTRLFFW